MISPQRREAGIRRRLRVPWMRQVLWERDNPQALVGRPEPTYAYPWTSRNALSKFSPACRCSMHRAGRLRYSRKGSHDTRG